MSYPSHLPHNGGYGQQPYQDHYGYDASQAYDDPYSSTQYHQQPYAAAPDNHYPPPPPEPAPYDRYQDGGRTGYGGGGYPSSQTLDEKSSSYGNLGGAGMSEQTLDAEPKRREGVFQNAAATQSRGDAAAQMAAEGAIPEKAGLRMWRSDEHAGAFTRGGRARCCGRCCCCSIIVAILLIICIISAFLLWVRPPNITFNGVSTPASGQQVNLIANGFNIDVDLNIGVTNPNFFGASFDSITATAFYPLNKTAPLGGGTMRNVDIKAHSNTTIRFPFQVNYTTTLDPSHRILSDLATKCGIIGGGATSQITVDYTLVLALKIAAIKISPSFSSTASFSCPLTADDIASALGADASSLSGILGSLTGSSSSGGGKRRSIGLAEDPARRASPRGYTDLARRLGVIG